MVRLRDGENTSRICVTVYTQYGQYRRVTDILPRHSTRYAYASCGKKMICVFNFPYPLLLLIYLLLNSCDGNDAEHNVFSSVDRCENSRLCNAVTVVLKSAGFSLADVQSDVLSRAHNRFLH